jgi:prepilin-type N-terminal cleavage/methylation domain-containing protein
MRKAESGFTLIELIVVIVILGILAVTAAAKFLNLTSDATSSVVKGLAGALRSSSSMVYAKSRLHTGDYWVCISDACSGSSVNLAEADVEKFQGYGKEGWIRIEPENGYPSSRNPPIPLINTIAGTVDLGSSSSGVTLDPDSDCTKVGDWIVGSAAGGTLDKDGKPEMGTMVFIPASSHADKDCKSSNYMATKDGGQVGIDSSDSCGVVFYNSRKTGTAPVIAVLTKGC